MHWHLHSLLIRFHQVTVSLFLQIFKTPFKGLKRLTSEGICQNLTINALHCDLPSCQAHTLEEVFMTSNMTLHNQITFRYFAYFAKVFSVGSCAPFYVDILPWLCRSWFQNIVCCLVVQRKLGNRGFCSPVSVHNWPASNYCCHVQTFGSVLAETNVKLTRLVPQIWRHNWSVVAFCFSELKSPTRDEDAQAIVIVRSFGGAGVASYHAVRCTVCWSASAGTGGPPPAGNVAAGDGTSTTTGPLVIRRYCRWTRSGSAQPNASATGRK